VLRVLQEFLPKVSGPANEALGSTIHLVEHGWTSTIATCALSQYSGEPLEVLSAGAIVRRYRSAGPILSSYLCPGVIRTVLGLKYDILHVHGFRNMVSDSAIFAAHRRGRPVVLQPDGMAMGYKAMLSGVRAAPFRLYDTFIGPAIIAKADAIVAATEAEGEECLTYGFPLERIVTIPIGVGNEFFLTRAPPTNDLLRRFLFVGRISRDRNIEALIRAIGYLTRAGYPVELRLVGRSEASTVLNRGGYLDEMRSLSHHLGVLDRVRFIGEQTGASLLDHYAWAQAFVYAARYDNFGIALLEAAAAGLPLVTTPVGVAPALVIQGRSGALLQRDGSDLGPQLETLMHQAQRAFAMGSHAQIIAQNFHWPAIATRYAELYSSLSS
jgi:glycosyltransferase involved in cell wall biosynthesis